MRYLIRYQLFHLLRGEARTKGHDDALPHADVRVEGDRLVAVALAAVGGDIDVSHPVVECDRVATVVEPQETDARGP